MKGIVRLLPRTYSIRDGRGNRRYPDLIEVAAQFRHSVNFFRDRREALRAGFEIFHAATFIAFVVFICHFMTVRTVLVYCLSVIFLALLSIQSGITATAVIGLSVFAKRLGRIYFCG